MGGGYGYLGIWSGLMRAGWFCWLEPLVRWQFFRLERRRFKRSGKDMRIWWRGHCGRESAHRALSIGPGFSEVARDKAGMGVDRSM
jgi:hypothetical protein